VVPSAHWRRGPLTRQLLRHCSVLLVHVQAAAAAACEPLCRQQRCSYSCLLTSYRQGAVALPEDGSTTWSPLAAQSQDHHMTRAEQQQLCRNECSRGAQTPRHSHKHQGHTPRQVTTLCMFPVLTRGHQQPTTPTASLLAATLLQRANRQAGCVLLTACWRGCITRLRPWC
jgi:hypothetical protein